MVTPAGVERDAGTHPGVVRQPEGVAQTEVVLEQAFLFQTVLDWLDDLEWTWEELGPEMTDPAGVVWQLAKWYPSYLMRRIGSPKYALILYHDRGPEAPRAVQRKFWDPEDIQEQRETLNYKELCVPEEGEEGEKPIIVDWARSLVEKSRVWRDPGEDTASPVQQSARKQKKALAVQSSKAVRTALANKEKKKKK